MTVPTDRAELPHDPTPPATASPATASATATGPVFWVCAAVGIVMILFGIHSVVRTRSTPIYWVGRWMFGLLVVHDGFITTAVGFAGWALTRWLPVWLSGPVRGALALTTIVVAFSLPLWQRRGIDPSNPSRLSLNYATAVVTVVAVVWIVSAVVAALRWRKRQRQH